LRKAKEAVTISVIASLNGATLGGWTDYAKEIEQAGVEALELNIYILPTDTEMPGVEVEHTYLDIVEMVKPHIRILWR